MPKLKKYYSLKYCQETQETQGFDKTCAEMPALDNQQRHNAASFLIQAMERGIIIKRMDSNDDEADKKRIEDKYKLHIEKIEKENADSILKAEEIDKETYSKMLDDAENDKEYYEKERYEIAEALNRPSKDLTVEDIDFYDKKGVKYTTNLQALNKGSQDAKAHDIRDMKAGVAITNAKWREAKVKLLELIFETLGIDINSGAGSYTQEQANKAVAAMKQDPSVQRYIIHRLYLEIDSNLSNIAFIHKIIKKLLGLKTNGTLMREGQACHYVFSIDPTSMQKLKKYHDLKYGDNRDDDT